MEDTEYIIESLWILERRSGICIFEENYLDFTKEGISTDMVGAFLAALLSFARETFTDEIQNIQFSNRKVFFKFSKHLLFVTICCNDKNNHHKIKEISNEIEEKFNLKYEKIFENDGWNGNTSTFREFSSDLSEIVKNKPLKLKFLEALDLKDNFKKFEKFLRKKGEHLLKNLEKFENVIEEFKIKKITWKKSRKSNEIRKLEDMFSI
ncbi:MAG: hypothetical protein ACFFAO_14335 [Candidatus Hermodarchaeota archaeon]